MNSLDDLVCQVADAANRGKVAILCGAGISRASGLPVVDELLDEVFVGLGFSEVKADQIVGRVPFEVVMAEIKGLGEINSLLSVFDSGEPNELHFFLAEMLRQNFCHAIATTNFDRLIESASMEIGQPLATPNTANDFAEIDFSRLDKTLMKIHGTIDNLESIAVTISEVSRSEVVEARAKCIRWLFKEGDHEIVILLGYSCSDHFDINKIIIQSGNIQKIILLINHAASEEVCEFASLSEAKSVPFLFYQNQSLMVTCNTQRFIKQLANALSFPLLDPRPNSAAMPWRHTVAKWVHDYKCGDPHGIASIVLEALLLKHINEPSRSFLMFKKAFDSLRFEKPSRIDAGLVNKLGLMAMGLAETALELHKFDIAYQYYDIAFWFFEKLDEKGSLVLALAGTASVLQAKGESQRALEILNDCWKAAKAFEDELAIRHIASMMGNVFKSLGALEEAFEYRRIAVQYAKQVGDMTVLVSAYGDLGLSCQDIGRLEDAAICHGQAVLLARTIGDRRQEAMQIGNIALVAALRDDSKFAEKKLLEALKISEEIGDLVTQTTQEENLAVVYYNEGRIKEAVPLIEKAYKQAVQIYGSDHHVSLALGRKRAAIVRA